MTGEEYAKKEVERFTRLVSSLSNSTERQMLQAMFELAWQSGFVEGVEETRQAMLKGFAQGQLSGAPVNGYG